MKLYEKERIKFKTYDLLESMVDLSKARKQEITDNMYDLIELISVGFNTGRQSGKTEAIINFIKNHYSNTDAFTKKTDVIVVVHCYHQKQMYIRNGIPESRIKVVSSNIDNLGLIRNTPEIIIFDEISYATGYKWINKNSDWHLEDIQSIVFVGLGVV